MSWTDERVFQLSRLWMEGRSASQIATAMGAGLTRNAVIGKVHRLGLAGRVKSNASAPGVAESALGQRGNSSDAAIIEVAVAPRRAATRQSSGHSLSAPASAVATARLQGNTALAMAEAPAEAVKPARSPHEVVVPMSLKVTIVELRESMCKWPIGDPSSADFRYCGSPAHTGTPYCQHHGKLAYQPAQDRRRERDRRPLLAR
jgi:GcrA cell cycle regulator